MENDLNLDDAVAGAPPPTYPDNNDDDVDNLAGGDLDLPGLGVDSLLGSLGNGAAAADFDGGGGGGIASDARLLRQAWINENCSPEVLEYKDDLVERVQSLISNQERIVEEYEQDHAKALTRAIRMAELSRVRFVLRSYLRTRLKKLEAFPLDTFTSRSERLSPQEAEFLKGFLDAMDKLFGASVLSHLPAGYESILEESSAMGTGQPDMVRRPDVGAYVLARITEDVGVLGDDVPVGVGETWATRYQDVASHVMEGRAELI